jgi:hypothetical protein
LRSVLANKSKAKPQISLTQRLKQIKADVEKIQVPVGKAQLSDFSFQPNDSWNAKQHAVYQVLLEKKPRTLLDVASGSGWFSGLAAQFGGAVVAFDRETEAVARLFRTAGASDLAILPLVMDFTRPTAARGLASHSHIAATDRFRCEMVLMLGFLHDLVFRYRRLGLNEISDGLALFSERWVVVEFIPGDDPEVGSLWSSWFEGYTLDNLKRALRRNFSKIEVLPSHPGSRVLLLCER